MSSCVDTIGNISNLRNTLYGSVRDDVREVEDYPDDDWYPDDYPDDEAPDAVSGAPADYADEDDPDEDYPDEDWAWLPDHRWRPVALFIGALVAIGAVGTAVIVNSGDSATTKATVGASAPRTVVSTTPRTAAPPSLSPTAPPSTSPGVTRPPLPRETITTVPPTSAPARTPTAVPPAPLPIPAGPPGAALSPQAVVYSITGTKQLFDLVNVVYTDARGFPVTEFNVALPWTKVVVLNPGVQTESVIATSIYGHLNCSIVNAQGQVVKAAVDSGMIATCTR